MLGRCPLIGLATLWPPFCPPKTGFKIRAGSCGQRLAIGVQMGPKIGAKILKNAFRTPSGSSSRKRFRTEGVQSVKMHTVTHFGMICRGPGPSKNPPKSLPNPHPSAPNAEKSDAEKHSDKRFRNSDENLRKWDPKGHPKVSQNR